jgi:hypothetical protein
MEGKRNVTHRTANAFLEAPSQHWRPIRAPALQHRTTVSSAPDNRWPILNQARRARAFPVKRWPVPPSFGILKMTIRKRVRVTERAKAYDAANAPTTGLVYALADAVAQSVADALGTPVDIVIHGMVKISRQPQKAA